MQQTANEFFNCIWQNSRYHIKYHIHYLKNDITLDKVIRFAVHKAGAFMKSLFRGLGRTANLYQLELLDRTHSCVQLGNG